MNALRNAIRRAVYKRDNFRCVACGWTPPGVDKWVKACYTGKHTYGDGDRYLTLDHVIPKSRGGQFRTANLQCMCDRCNRAKGNKLPQEVR